MPTNNYTITIYGSDQKPIGPLKAEGLCGTEALEKAMHSQKVPTDFIGNAVVTPEDLPSYNISIGVHDYI